MYLTLPCTVCTHRLIGTVWVNVPKVQVWLLPNLWADQSMTFQLKLAGEREILCYTCLQV